MSIRSHVALLAGVVIAASAAVLADEFGPGTFDLSWSTVDAGGGVCTGGNLVLHGSIGQPDSGPALGGGSLQLLGGFWPAAGSVEPVCPADVSGDGVVNIVDLLAVISAWGTIGSHPADVNNDGVVNIADLLAVISDWGMCP